MPIGTLEIIMAADTAQLRKGMDTAVSIMQSSTKKMESFAKTAGASIASYFALSNLQSSIKESLDLADSIGKLSQKVGISVDLLYSLQAAGQLSDVALQDIGKSVLKLNKNLGEISMGGGKDAQNALENLGISSKDVNGHIKDSNTVLLEVADRFKDMPNGVAKSTLAMQLFGKSGADMIPLLNGGSEALTEFSGIMNSETAASAEKFNDSMTTVGLAVDAVWMQMTSALSPTLSAIADDFVNVAKEGKGTGKTLGDDLAKGMKVAINLGYIVAGSFDMAGHAIGNLGAAASMFAQGDFDGAKYAWDRIAKDADADQKRWDDRIKKVMSATAETQKASDEERKANSGALVDFEAQQAKKEAALKKAAADEKKRQDEAKKAAKELSDSEQRMFDERINDGIKRFEEENQIKIGYLEAYADIEAKAALEQYEIEKGYLEAYADIEAKTAIEEFERQTKLWDDLFSNINKAMDDQFFNAMTGKFKSFGSWLKDFWSSITESMARGLSKTLADTILGTGSDGGGLQNVFKSFGGLGAVFGSAATPAALLGSTTDSAGFTTTSGGTVFDVAGQITKDGSDVAGVLDALSSAKSVYSIATNGITGYMGGIAGNLANAAGWMNGIGFTAGGNFLTGAGSIFAGNGMLTSSTASMLGSGVTAGALGGLGGYAMGSIGDKLFGADTKAASYGAIGGSIGAIAGSIIPGLGTLVGGAIGSALGSLIGGAFGKTKQTGSGLMAWADISSDSGAGAVQSYADFRKKSWFKSSSWTNYYGLSEKERQGIEGIFSTYDYLLGQLGDVDEIVVGAGKYSGTSFYNAVDKAFIRAFIDNPALTDTFYSAWTDYASQIGKAVQETFATMVSGYVDYTRNYKTWMLESSGDTLEALRLKSEWAQGDLNAYSNLIGVSGVTVENYLDMYSQAIKTTFTPETITNWQKLGDALKNSTELTKSYTDALKEQTAYIPADMMLSKVGTTTAAIDLKQLVNKQSDQNLQTSQMVAQLYEVVKVLKQQLTILQFGNNTGVPA